MNTPTLSQKFALMFFLPTRIITVFTVLTLIPIFNVSWEIATTVFQIFFPVYVVSFLIECILTEGDLKKNFQSVGSKYTIGLPVEFAGVASFALLSFSTNPDAVIQIGIYISATVIACAFFVEGYHHYVVPKLAKIKLSEKQSIFVVIPFTVFLVIFGTYYLNFNPFF